MYAEKHERETEREKDRMIERERMAKRENETEAAGERRKGTERKGMLLYASESDMAPLPDLILAMEPCKGGCSLIPVEGPQPLPLCWCMSHNSALPVGIGYGKHKNIHS